MTFFLYKIQKFLIKFNGILKGFPFFDSLQSKGRLDFKEILLKI